MRFGLDTLEPLHLPCSLLSLLASLFSLFLEPRLEHRARSSGTWQGQFALDLFSADVRVTLVAMIFVLVQAKDVAHMVTVDLLVSVFLALVYFGMS